MAEQMADDRTRQAEAEKVYLEFLVHRTCALYGLLYLLYHQRHLFPEGPLRLSAVLRMRSPQVLHKVIHNDDIPVLYCTRHTCFSLHNVFHNNILVLEHATHMARVIHMVAHHSTPVLYNIPLRHTLHRSGPVQHPSTAHPSCTLSTETNCQQCVHTINIPLLYSPQSFASVVHNNNIPVLCSTATHYWTVFTRASIPPTLLSCIPSRGLNGVLRLHGQRGLDE
jgi:hypothetical protein